MKYLLDANVVIALLSNTDSRVMRRIRKQQPGEVGVSVIVIHELYYGAFKSNRSKYNLELVDSLHFEVVDFNQEDARQAGEIRAALSLKGTPIGAYDVLIAAQAKSRNLTLVTHNTREFKRVPGLRLDDWQK